MIDNDEQEKRDLHNIKPARFKVGASSNFAEHHPDSIERISKHQLIYSIAGLLLGLMCIVGGVALFLNGVAGSSSWTANLLGSTSEITDAAPGGILFIVGLFIVFVTRYVVKIGNA